jgi:hypothetical protein
MAMGTKNIERRRNRVTMSATHDGVTPPPRTISQPSISKKYITTDFIRKDDAQVTFKLIRIYLTHMSNGHR